MRGVLQVILAILVAWVAQTSLAFLPNFLLRQRPGARCTNDVLHVGVDPIPGMKGGSFPEDDETFIRNAYDSWRFKHNKGKFDAMRFENFKGNYLSLVETNAAAGRKARREGNSAPKIMELDEFGDCSAAERNAKVQNEIGEGASPQDETHSSGGRSLDLSGHFEAELDDLDAFTSENKSSQIEHAYREWCQFYGKEYDRKRFDVFASNYKDVESYFKSTGKPVQLNKHADLTAEEFATLQTPTSSLSTSGANGAISSPVPDTPWIKSEGKKGLSVEDIKKKAMEGARLIEEEQQRIAEAKRKAEADNRAKNEYFARVLEQDQARRESRLLPVEDALTKALEDARVRAEADAKRREEEERLAAEAAAVAKAEEEARMKAEAEAKRKAVEAAAVAKAEEEARMKAEAEAKRKEAEAKRKEEETARIRAEEEVRAKAAKEAEARAKAEQALADHIRDAYKEYCKFYEKEFNESRLPIFGKKLIEMKDQLGDSAKTIELDECADLTLEECESLKKSTQQKADKELKQASPEESDPHATDTKHTADSVTAKAEAYAKSKADDAESVYLAYAEWCNEHGKEFDVDRLKNFAWNYRKVEKYQQSTGKIMKLNEYSDLSSEEYKELMATNMKSASAPNDENPTSSSTAEVRAVYNQWCEHYGKESSDWRFPNFQSNYLRAERHFKTTGEALGLDELADLSPEERMALEGEKLVIAEKLISDAQGARNEEIERIKAEAASEIKELQAKLKAAEEDSRRKEEEVQKEASRLAKEKAELREAEDARIKAEENARRKAKEALEDARRKAEENAKRRKAEETTSKQGPFPVENTGVIKRTMAEVEELRKAQRLLEQERLALEDAKKRVHDEIKKIGDEVELARKSRQIEEQIEIEVARRMSRQIDEQMKSSSSKNQEKGDWIDSVLSVFGTKEEDRDTPPGRGTISLQSKENTSPFNIFVNPQSTTVSRSAQDSKIPDEASGLNASPFKFFQGSGKVDRDTESARQQQSNSPFLPFLGGATRSNESNLGRQNLDNEKRRAIRERKARRREEKASKLAAERARALEEASAKEAAKVKRETQGQGKKEDFLSWFGKARSVRSTQDIDFQHTRPPPRSSQQLVAGQPPTLSMWYQNRDGSISGIVSDSAEYRSGTKITTSPIRGKPSAGSIVTTVSGSQYYLSQRKGRGFVKP